MDWKTFQQHLRRLGNENQITFELEHRTKGTNTKPKHTTLVLAKSIEDCKTKNVKIVFMAQGKAK